MKVNVVFIYKHEVFKYVLLSKVGEAKQTIGRYILLFCFQVLSAISSSSINKTTR